MIRSTTIAIVIALVMAVSGCGGGGGNGDPPSKGTSVVVTPSGIGQVWQGTKVQFAAQVIGQTNQAVTWSVQEGSAGGVIDSTGLYTAPSAAGSFHVVATSQADSKVSGIATVEVPAMTVSISPPAENLRIGGSRQFGGFAIAADQRVTWDLEEGVMGGTITPDGLYTAPSRTGTFHLRATAVYNTNVSSTAPITIVSTGFANISDMSVARSGHTATLLSDGRVLVAGGTDDSIHSAELFDPATGSFEPVSGAMIHLRGGHSAALLLSGKVLIAGGSDSNGVLFPIAELFDPASQTFSATGDLGQMRTHATATLLPGGKVLIAGGQDSQGTLLSTAELYDPGTGTFSPTGNMQSPRAEHTATLLANGKVLLVGSSESIAEAELFDPASGVFTATGSLSTPRAHHTAVLLPDGTVLVLGGAQMMMPGGGGAAPAPVSIDGVEVYDPASGKFETVGKLAGARDSHSATLLPSGAVLVAGGYVHDFDGDAQPSFDTMFQAELIDPATMVSTSAASLEQARAEHVATLLNNGQVLITGGRVGYQELCCNPKPHTSSLASAELYR
jgi:WD40 repeat protein